MNPEIVLLDEPAAGMNSEETEDIARFIIDLHEEKKKNSNTRRSRYEYGDGYC